MSVMNKTIQRRTSLFLASSLVILGIVFTTSCNQEKRAAQQTVSQYLQSSGAKDIAFDLYVTSPSVPGQAYVAASDTLPSADQRGNPQKEYLGLILKKVDNQWKIDHITKYTKDSDAGRDLLEGRKPHIK